MHNYISSLPNTLNSLNFPRKIAILGSTGSIGCNALKVIQEHPELFEVIALAGATNIELLSQQARQWQPKYLALLESENIEKLRSNLPGAYNPEITSGQQGYIDLATLEDADLVLSAQVGASGLAPTLAAIQKSKTIALANKEALVLAGHLIRKACKNTQSYILPVDSEHNAIFQALHGQDCKALKKLILTASGGPFHGQDEHFLSQVTAKQALKHPNWSMGAKISIDSSTLMNKGLEVIEAYHLFGVGLEKIQVVVHPESIIHSLVEYSDGSHLAQMGLPDMQTPIAYCLGYPRRLSLPLDSLDLVELGKLTFASPDLKLFPCLRLAKEALLSGPSYPVVLNAVNEVAVELFLQEAITYRAISNLIEQGLEEHQGEEVNSIEDIQALDRKARKDTYSRVQKLKR